MSESNINGKVVEMVKERLALGATRYNSPVRLDDSRYWIQEALEEALDLSVYLSARLLQIKTLEQGGEKVYICRGGPSEDSMEHS